MYVMCPILQCEMEGLKLTPLHVACEYGHEEIARILIEMGGANLEAENKKRQTLLHKGLIRMRHPHWGSKGATSKANAA